MTFKWECLSYDILLGQEANKPVAIIATYKDGKMDKKVIVPFVSKHLDEAIWNLKESLGHPKADRNVDNF